MGNLYNHTEEEVATWSSLRLQSSLLAIQSYANACEDEIIKLNAKLREYYKREREYSKLEE